MDEGKPWHFKASFEVMPEINIGDYKDLKPEKKDVSVSDKEVEEALQHLREMQRLMARRLMDLFSAGEPVGRHDGVFRGGARRG